MDGLTIDMVMTTTAEKKKSRLTEDIAVQRIIHILIPHPLIPLL